MENLNAILSQDSKTKTCSYRKGQILQREGELNNNVYYVKKGLLRSYTIDKKGKEHIFLFATEGWLMTDIDSQEFNKPTNLFIDCIEESEVITFDYQVFKKEKLKDHKLKQNINLLTKRIIALQRRVLMLMSASAAERYNKFLETYPELPNRIPQHMIASYLGITPQALSNIRKKTLKKQIN